MFGKPDENGTDDRPVLAVLRWQDDNGGQQSLTLHEGDTVHMGRSSRNEVVLPSSRVSAQHAVVTWGQGAFELADLGSTNRTRVNGEAIGGPVGLGDGDVIRVGDREVSFHTVGRAEPVPEPGAKTVMVPLSESGPRLVVSAGAQEGREIALVGHHLVIGRVADGEAWDIMLPDPAISRPHAKLERAGDTFVLTDLGSANFTLVNGQVIGEPTLLQDGDVVLLGETTLVFRAR